MRLHGGKLDSNPDSDHLSHVDCDPDSNPDSGPGARVNAVISLLGFGGVKVGSTGAHVVGASVGAEVVGASVGAGDDVVRVAEILLSGSACIIIY